MKHLIEFRKSGSVAIEKGGVTTRINICRGVCCPANVRCYIMRYKHKPIEVADVEVEEGLLRAIPCYCFMFIDALD